MEHVFQKRPMLKLSCHEIVQYVWVFVSSTLSRRVSCLSMALHAGMGSEKTLDCEPKLRNRMIMFFGSEQSTECGLMLNPRKRVRRSRIVHDRN